MPSTLGIIRKNRGVVVATLLVLAALYVAVPQLGFFDANWDQLLRTDIRWFVLAVGLLLLSFAAASGIYLCLSTVRLPFGRTYLVQMASAFASKALPAGIGSISVNYLYLRKQRLSAVNAGATVAINNLLGFVGHNIWLLLITLFWAGNQAVPSGFHLDARTVLGVLSIICVLGVAVRLFAARLGKATRQVKRQLATYRRYPTRFVGALLLSMSLTACNIAMLYVAGIALGVPITFVAAAIALTAGLLAQTVTPTPGGVGGVEAGIVAGLVLAGLQSDQAIVVTILFRVVTFWVPLVIGGGALVVVLKKKLI